MDVFRQFGAGERLSNRVVAYIGYLAQTVEQAERLEDARINANAYIGVSGFNSLQSRAGGERAFRHYSHWQPSAAAGVVDVGTELAQGAPYCGGRIVRCRHLKPS